MLLHELGVGSVVEAGVLFNWQAIQHDGDSDCALPSRSLQSNSSPMERPDPVTIDQMATLAGVSSGTVLRVLNGKNKENRPAIARRSERIRQIAIELGYRPNAAARSMLRGSFRAVSFVTCGDLGTDWYPISGLNGIHTSLEKRDWRLIYHELPAKVITDPNLVPSLFRESAVDGLLVNLLPAFNNEVADYFESQPVPCVWLNLKRPMRAVYPDEFGGAAMGVQWLVRRGYQRLGYFCRQFTSKPHFSLTERFNGFQHAMHALELPSHRHLDLKVAAGSSAMPVLERARMFLQTFGDVQAVVCYEMEEAVCMRVAAEGLGRVVGKDVMILAYAEREIRTTTGLDIPTLIVPFNEVGRRAVEMLETIIDTHRQDVPSVAVPFQSILI